MTVDDLQTMPESEAPVDMLEAYCAAHGWSHERNGEDELTARIRGSWGEIELRGLWRSEDGVLQLIALSDIRAAGDHGVPIHDAIGLVNEQMWLGHFELWRATGNIVYRHAVLLSALESPQLTLDGAETIVETAIGEWERFYPVFQFVLWGGKTPQEAIAAALIDVQGEA